jgi:eukaryotic-like serine/threonine-protein kinase
VTQSQTPPPRPSTPAPRTERGSAPSIIPRDPEGLPKRFGKYTLLKKIATGGMAELFLAIQKSVAGFEKLIVIKRILPAMNQDRAFIDMFLHEARIAATLSHPNIVQIFDVGQIDGTYFIAMEHVHGEDLRSIVRQMRKKNITEFPVEHALAVLLGLCAGLAYAHDKRDLDGSPLNIVHRDVSPQNLVVTFTGDVKIVDFGIAKSDTKMVNDTKSGKLKGKIPYMSPEQARGELVDWRSDIFAAGVMLFELTTGKRLFKGQSEFETLKLICEREYPRPSQVRARYPQELESVVMRALAKDRNARFQSAREMQGLLEEFVRRERVPVSNIALSQFMQFLFAEKVAAQKEALQQGKQLADIIAAQEPDNTDPYARVTASGQSIAPPAGRTVTDASIATPRKRTALAAFLVLATTAAGVAGTFAWINRAKLVAGAPGPAPMQVAATPQLTHTGALAIATDPPGAAIWINGERRSEVTPATLGKLPMGTVQVRLTKDGFDDVEQTVTLTDDNATSAVSVALKHATFGVDVSFRPPLPGSSITVDGKVSSSPNVDGLVAGDSHRLVAWAPGYIAQTFSFTGVGGDKKHFDVSLVKLDPRSKDPGPISGNGGTGKIYVGARGGWCNVAIDGAGRGPTPVAGIQVSAGSHAITCTTPEGKTLSASVNVPADGAARYGFTIPQ